MTASENAYFHVNPLWETLFTEGNDVVFVNAAAGHIRLKGKADLVRPLLEAIEAGTDLRSALRAYDERQGQFIVALLDQLLEEDILFRGKKTLPELDQAEQERFGSFIAWLRGVAGPSNAFPAYKKLRDARVTVVGAGGTGSLATLMLASCGVGEITIVDGDTVDRSNLVRQLLYTEAQARDRVLKVEAVKAYLRDFTPYTSVISIPRYVSNVGDFLPLTLGRDIVLLTADAPRIILNREANKACVATKTPLLHAFIGQVGPLFVPRQSACFACLETHWRAEAGPEHDELVELMRIRPTREYPSMVAGPVETAKIMLEEALMLITGIRAPRSMGGLVRVDAPDSVETVERVRGCPVCGDGGRRRP